MLIELLGIYYTCVFGICTYSIYTSEIYIEDIHDIFFIKYNKDTKSSIELCNIKKTS